MIYQFNSKGVGVPDTPAIYATGLVGDGVEMESCQGGILLLKIRHFARPYYDNTVT